MNFPAYAPDPETTTRYLFLYRQRRRRQNFAGVRGRLAAGR